MIQGISVADNSVSYAAMSTRQAELADAILKDPDVTSITSYIGIDGTNTTLNNGRFLINLKAHDDRSLSAQADRAALAGRGGEYLRHQAVPAAGAGSHPRHRGLAEPVSIRAARSEPAGLPAIRARARDAHEADQVDCRRHQRSEQRRSERQRRGEPSTGGALRHHSRDHRQRAVRCAGPAHRLHHIQPIEPVPRGAGGKARGLPNLRVARQPLSSDADRQQRSGAVARHRRYPGDQVAARDQSPGAVSRGHGVLQPRPGRLLERGRG